nr:immunoglobulin heavy chain junction region [Homo sapiens]
ISTAYLQWSS